MEVAPGEEVVVETPVVEVVLLPVRLDAEVEVVVVSGPVVVTGVLVVGTVVPVVVVDARRTAAAAAITIITTITTAITTLLIASKLNELFPLGLEDTKVAITIALFRICYHVRAWR